MSDDKNTDFSLLTSALSAVADVPVYSWEEYEKQNPESRAGALCIERVFYWKLDWSMLSPGTLSKQDSSYSPGTLFEITVITLTGKNINVMVAPSDITLQIKKQILDKEGIPLDQQGLIFKDKRLSDMVPIEDYGIKDKDIIHLVLTLRGGGIPIYGMKKEQFDPQYNFDYSTIDDTGKTFTRGGLPYGRPIGYKRYALKVLNKYESNIWLGAAGNRELSSDGEWPVSFHGTGSLNANSIASEGYNVSLGRRFLFGKGIYSTPNIEIASSYAKEFTHKGGKYHLIFQNRVNPAGVQRFKGKKGEFWLTRNDKDTRPYGICIRKV